MSNDPGGPKRDPRTVGIFNFIRRIGFPSTLETLSALVTMVLLSCIVAFPVLGLDLVSSVQFALILILFPIILGDVVASYIVLRDRVLDYRRILGLEIIGWAPALLIFPLGALLGIFGLRPPWQDLITLVISISLPVRVLSFVSLARPSYKRKLVSALSVPMLVSLTVSVVEPATALKVFSSLVVASILSIVGVVSLIRGIEKDGTWEVGASPMELFRAFLQHWLNHDPKSLEEALAPLGLDDDIRTITLAFFRRDSKHKGSIVVGSFHPGPYRDLGSGGLPSLVKHRLETRFGGVVLVPHGISGHQSNIITNRDIVRYLQDLERNFPSRPRTATASRMDRAVDGIAKASGQLFNNTVLVTLTLSPEDMEDMPQELDRSIRQGAKGVGLDDAVVVDAHNSMQVETVITQSQADQLYKATEKMLARVRGVEQSGFKAGFAWDPVSVFTREDGIGPGGVSALVVSSQGQKVAYVTIDGNNMEPGFRETILSSLRELGIEDGEVMTTDTHLVTGLVRSPLGYYQVGAHLDKTIFLDIIRRTVKRAIDDLEDVMLDVSNSSIRVRVLGKETFQRVTQYIRQVGGRVRKLFYLLELACSLTTLLILVLL